MLGLPKVPFMEGAPKTVTTETRSSDYVTFTSLSGEQRLRAVAYGSLQLASCASGFEPRISDCPSCT